MFLRSFACTLHTRCRRVLAPRGTGCVAVHRSFRRRAGQRRQVLFQPYRPPPGPVLQNHRQARRQKMPTTPLPIPAGLILTGLPRWHARLVGRSVLALLLMLARCVCLLRARWVDSRLAQGGSAAEHAVCGSDVARPAWNGGHRRRCGGPLPYKLCTAVLSYPTRMTRTGHGAD